MITVAIRIRPWLKLVRPGDWLVALLAISATVYAALSLWSPDRPTQAVVRAGGKTVATLPLDRASHFEVSGPLGLTRIEVEPGRARVLSDPGPRQYCVKQGWLTRNGAAAICAPNEVSLQLNGRRETYDSMAY